MRRRIFGETILKSSGPGAPLIRPLIFFSWIRIFGLPIVAWNMECIKCLMGEECRILRYNLTSISKGVISGITILVGKSPSASLN